MDIIEQKGRPNRLSHDFATKLAVAKRIRESGWTVKKAAAYYHVSRTSAWRWCRRYDGTDGSLKDRSHKTKTPCAFATSKAARYKIKCLHKKSKQNGMSSTEIWMKARRMGFDVSYSSVLRVLKGLEGYERHKANPKRKHDKKYHTPADVGEKWQMDVKFVPGECKAPTLDGRFYQYTVLDEASRKRFLYFAAEHSMWESANALRAAVAYFGYAPKVLQTDNGSEFSDKAFKKENSRYGRDYPNALEPLLSSLGIAHKFIRPRTPEHNGKVERSHRVDQERFYATLSFYSLPDLREQGGRWNKRYNDMPKAILGLKTPNEAELESLRRLLQNTGEVRCPKRLKRFTSADN